MSQREVHRSKNYHVIRKQGNQVCQLVEEAVLAAEIDSGHLEFRFIEFDLRKFLGEIVAEASQKSGREIGFNPPAGEVHSLGDPIYLRKAVQHLIENAIKFSDPGSNGVGQLKSFTKGWVLLSIKDLGVGIDEMDQSNYSAVLAASGTRRTLDIPATDFAFILPTASRVPSRDDHLKTKPNQGSTFTIQLFAVNHA
jgi:light-regulated signal transduction histidine kinase (bacteriophytochrome)